MAASEQRVRKSLNQLHNITSEIKKLADVHSQELTILCQEFGNESLVQNPANSGERRSTVIDIDSSIPPTKLGRRESRGSCTTAASQRRAWVSEQTYGYCVSEEGSLTPSSIGVTDIAAKTERPPPDPTPQRDSNHVQWSVTVDTTLSSAASYKPQVKSDASPLLIIHVHPAWTEEHSTTKVVPLLRARSWKSGRDSALLLMDEAAEEKPPGKLHALVLDPGGSKRLCWEIFGMALIFYDLITIPLQIAFDLQESTFTIIWDWLTICYWTLDIPLSFLVGFHTKGVVEMRLSIIAKRYLQGWFSFDVSVISVDWLIKAVAGSDKQIKSFLRILRVIRLLRLLKLAALLSSLVKRIKAESVIIFLGILRLIIFILCVNHVIACVWYWVGVQSSKYTSKTWIEYNNLEDTSVAYKYTTSLHWSLTQFTPASMEVTPRNAAERTYTVLTLIGAMVTFSSFVSSITTAMTRLRNLNSERAEQYSVLRQYLVENNISVPLTSAVCGFLEKDVNKDGQRIHLQSVKILQLLPKCLQDEIRDQVYTPSLTRHPFFDGFYATYPKGMSRLYRSTLDETSLSGGQELFTMGEAASKMYFVLTGKVVYSLGTMRTDGDVSSELVGPPEWLCEQALWIEWRHCGQAVGAVHTELLAVKADRFQSTVCRELIGISEPRCYAVLFAARASELAKSQELTDICQARYLAAIYQMAHKTWGPPGSAYRPSSTDRQFSMTRSMKSSISTVAVAMSWITTSARFGRKSPSHR